MARRSAAPVQFRLATARVPDGRMVVVFANKSPNAWETLVSAIIPAGFVVDGSWPRDGWELATVETTRPSSIKAIRLMRSHGA